MSLLLPITLLSFKNMRKNLSDSSSSKKTVIVSLLVTTQVLFYLSPFALSVNEMLKWRVSFDTERILFEN